MSRKKSEDEIPHAEVHARVLKRLREATDEEFIQSLKDAGILTRSGKLAAPYRRHPVISYRDGLGTDTD